jgi:hypothetical protein
MGKPSYNSIIDPDYDGSLYYFPTQEELDKEAELDAKILSEVRIFDLKKRTYKTDLNKEDPYYHLKKIVYKGCIEINRRQAEEELHRLKNREINKQNFFEKIKEINTKVSEQLVMAAQTNISLDYKHNDLLIQQIEMAYKINPKIDSQQHCVANAVREKARNFENNKNLEKMVAVELKACQAARFFFQPKSRLEKKLEKMSKAVGARNDNAVNSNMENLRHELLTYTYKIERSWSYKFAGNKKRKYIQEKIKLARKIASAIDNEKNTIIITDEENTIYLSIGLRNIFKKYPEFKLQAEINQTSSKKCI